MTISLVLLLRLQIDAATYSVMSLASAETLRGGGGEIAVLAQHETVVLDHRAAARRRHQDGVEAVAIGLCRARPRCWRGRAPARRRRARDDGSTRRSIARP